MRLPPKDPRLSGGVPRSISTKAWDCNQSLTSEAFHRAESGEDMSIFGFSAGESIMKSKAPSAVARDDWENLELEWPHEEECKTQQDGTAYFSTNNSLYTFDDETIYTNFVSVHSRNKAVLFEGIPTDISKSNHLSPEEQAAVRGKIRNSVSALLATKKDPDATKEQPPALDEFEVSVCASERSHVKELIVSWNSADNSTKKDNCCKTSVKSPLKDKIAMFDRRASDPLPKKRSKRKASTRHSLPSSFNKPPSLIQVASPTSSPRHKRRTRKAMAPQKRPSSTSHLASSTSKKKNPTPPRPAPKSIKSAPTLLQSNKKKKKKRGLLKKAMATILEHHTVVPSDKNNYWKQREDKQKQQRALVPFKSSWKFWKSSRRNADTKVRAVAVYDHPNMDQSNTSATSQYCEFEVELLTRQRELLEDTESVFMGVSAWA